MLKHIAPSHLCVNQTHHNPLGSFSPSTKDSQLKQTLEEIKVTEEKLQLADNEEKSRWAEDMAPSTGGIKFICASQ